MFTDDTAKKSSRRSAMAATILATGGAALLGGQASAQDGAPDGYRSVGDFANVDSYTINEDGTVRLVMNDGQVVTVAATDAQLIDGVLYLNADAITVGAAAAAGGGGGAILGVVGGLGLAGAAAGGGGGGGGGSTPPPTPNTPPSFTSDPTGSTTENSTSTGYTAAASDADGNSLTYSISGGADAALFSINASTGELTFNNAPDFENPGDANSDNVYEVTVRVSDGQGGAATQTVQVTVTDVDEAPVFSSSSTVSVAENQTTAIDVDASDPDGQAVTYSLSGADAALFNIDANTGEVTFINAPDFENPADANGDNDYEITVTADDGTEQSSQDITISVTNQNDNSPVITSAAAFNVDENQTTAFTGTATDGDGDAITYSLSGADAALFNIDANTGEVTFVNAPDRENPADANSDNVYEINLIASDGTTQAVQAVTVTVDDVNEAPSFTSASTATVSENQTTAIDADATDPEGQALTYTLSGADAALFSIDANTGEVTFIAAPDYENPADANSDNDYEITVTASDGSNQTSQDITISVTNQNDNSPTITSGAAFSVDENQTTAFTGAATDADGDAITYSLTGADAALFNIDANTGEVTFINPPDFESPADANSDNDYEVNLVASDGVNTDVQAVTITVDDVSDVAPVITSSATANADENQTAAYTITATDADNSGPLVYSISGADAALFSVDSVTGEVTFNAAPDFENPGDANNDGVYEITVSVTDGDLSDSQAVSITVDNVNEAPSFTSGATASVAENQTTAIDVDATDPEGQSLTYSLSGADAALFNIDANTGEVTFIAAPDFENPVDANGDNDYEITVTADDGTDQSSQNITITVTDENEAPVITSGAAFSVAENQTAAFTGAATDDDGDTLTYSLTGTDAALFNIDANTGEVTFISAPDRENPADGNSDNVYEINLVVSDGAEQDVQAVTITVTNIDEAPVFASSTAFNVVEGQTDAFTADATDPEGNAITYSLSGADAALFSIDPNTGEVTFLAAPDFDTPADADTDNVYELTVTADDGAITTDQNVSVTVTESTGNAAPVFVTGTSSSVSENQTSAYATQWTNAEETDTITFSLSGTDASLFQVDSTTGEVSFINTPDFEAPGDGNSDNVYEFTLTISDGFQDVSQNISVTVGDASDGTEVPADDTTTISMVSGGSYVGNLETPGDQDWISIELVAGQRYEFNLEGTGANDLDDPYLRLYDSSGTLIAENDDISLGTILDSRLGFTAQTSGTYYISAGAYTSDTQPGTTGEYTLSVEHTEPLGEWTNDQIADYLNQNGWNGAQWNVTAGDTLTVDITALTTAGQTLARAALDAWTEITGIIFQEVTSGGQIVFDDDEDGAFAGPSGITGGFFTGATVNVGTDWLDTYGTNLDGYSFQTYMHEIGHALGLGHAGPYDGSADYAVDAIYLNDSWQTTIMSYFSQNENTYLNATFAFLMTPMMADIIAAQNMYGGATNTRTGDTTYGYNTNAGAIYDATAWGNNVAYTIFDNGGTDTLDFSGYSGVQELDLRAEEYSDVQGGRSNVAIARGVVIENAIGGSGNEVFIGNDADNVLTGNAGNDSFYASGGNDTFRGGTGNDTAYFSGSSTDYSVTTNGSGNTVVTDLRAGSPNGVVELIDVENIVYDTEIPDSTEFPLGQENDAGDLSIEVQDPGCICCAAGQCDTHDHHGHSHGKGEPAGLVDLLADLRIQNIDQYELRDLLESYIEWSPEGGLRAVDDLDSSPVGADAILAALSVAAQASIAEKGAQVQDTLSDVTAKGTQVQDVLVDVTAKAAPVQDGFVVTPSGNAVEWGDEISPEMPFETDFIGRVPSLEEFGG
ncbi:MAG: cadherin domain-containing protein [Maricaulis sp.]|uniref:cadherin domain-containing protein n=1 Tax=Maricaulis sp. TaxID=1486257 RepID=UPI001B04E3C4|nr:cadherin domain-containing protein [Maricaulis sp.]MBO6848410.1 cadherin domain-containing protein [Maricaulis sp.]MBO6878218.1 cadherin domain-containing protein [Maricaulis sp.]